MGNSFPSSKMQYDAKSAHALSTFRHLCAFSCIPTLFFSNGWWWVSFLDNFLWGIHSHHQKCDWVQKVRTHSALLGTCVHFHAYLHFFPQINGDGCHFWIIFLWGIHSHHPILAYLHFFPKMADDGCIFGFYFLMN